MADGEREELERLDTAVYRALAALVEVVGVPASGKGGERLPVPGCAMIDREQVPAVPLRLAETAVDVLLVASGLLDATIEGDATPEEQVSVEEGLELLTGGRPGVLAPADAAAAYRWAVGDGRRELPQDREEMRSCGRALRFLVDTAGDELEWVPIEGAEEFGMLARLDEQTGDSEGGR